VGEWRGGGGDVAAASPVCWVMLRSSSKAKLPVTLDQSAWAEFEMDDRAF